MSRMLTLLKALRASQPFNYVATTCAEPSA